MNGESFDRVRADLSWLKKEDGVASEQEAIQRLANVLRPLLKAEGFEISIYKGGDNGFDLLAMQQGQPTKPKIGIEYKHRGGGRPLAVEAVRQVIGMSARLPFERALLIGRFGFTTEALRMARDFTPTSIQLLDLEELAAWVARIEKGFSPNESRVQFLIRAIAHDFARAVADHPEELNQLEWRDLERMMARDGGARVPCCLHSSKQRRREGSYFVLHSGK